MNEGAHMLATQRNFSGGADAYRPASALGETQSALLENMLVDGEWTARARPGLKALGSGQNVVRANFSGLAYFNTEAVEALLYIANSSVWEYSARTGNYTWKLKAALTGAPAGFPRAGARVAWAQGIAKLLLSDGVNHCAIWDGAADTWSDAGAATGDSGDAPVGATILLWHGFGTGTSFSGSGLAAGTWRMFASGQDANPDTVWVSDVLEFGPGAWDHLTWSFRVGGGEGQRITALAALPAAALLVGKSASIYLVSTPATAASAADYSIVPLSQSVGIVNSRAVTTLGETLLMVCTDGGIRAVSRMAAATGQFELGAPLSQPMQPYIDRINWEAAGEIRAASYKQWAFFGLPLDDSETVSHVLVYSGRTQSWCGAWTGWEVKDWLVSRFNDRLEFLVASTRVASLVVGAAIAVVGKWDEQADRLDPETFEDLEAPYTCRWRSRALAPPPYEESKDLAWVRVVLRESSAGVTLRVLMDEAPVKTMTLAPSYAPPRFDALVTKNPRLPFLLPDARLQSMARGVNHLRHGLEPQVEIEATGGNLEIRSVTLATLAGIVKGA